MTALDDLDDEDRRALGSSGTSRSALALGATAVAVPFFFSLRLDAFDYVALGGALVALLAGPAALWRAARRTPRSMRSILGALLVIALALVHVVRGTPVLGVLFAERDAGRVLVADGFENVRLTPRPEGGFAFDATRAGEHCRGFVEVGDGLFGTRSFHSEACGLPIPVEELEASCAGGVARACRDAAQRLRDADLTSARATELAERGCFLADVEACFYVGVAHERGDRGVRRSDALAFAMYDRSCRGGVASACHNVGIFLSRGFDGVARDATHACDAFERGCDLGHLGACHELGICLADAQGRPADAPRALALFERACAGGEALSCDAAGQLALRAGDGARAVPHYERACTGGSGVGCLHLALMRAEGRGGLPRDALGALAALDVQCRDGVARACLHAGVLRNEGRAPIVRDEARALVDFERGCELADALSCRDAGVYHREGRGGASDRSLAQRRFARACELGDRPSCDEPS